MNEEAEVFNNVDNTESTAEVTTETTSINYSDILVCYDTLYKYHAFECTILLFILLALFIIIGCHLAKSLWR